MKLRIGTRGSQLALWQAQFVAQKLQTQDVSAQLVIIQTQGDADQLRPTQEIGGKGVFVKQIESSLLEKEVDIGVHSLKDLPYETPEGLTLCAFLERHSPCDSLIFADHVTLPESFHGKTFLSLEDIKHLPSGLRIGSSSLRRKSLIKRFHNAIEVDFLRGNIDTRLKGLEAQKWDGIFLARAGLDRLCIGQNFRQFMLDPTWFIPSAGQGVLTIEARSADLELVQKIQHIFHCQTTAEAVFLERSIVGFTGADCHLPLGVYACKKPDQTWSLGVFAGFESNYFSDVFESKTGEHIENFSHRVISILKEKNVMKYLSL